jgi:hypothetical protein
MAMPNKKDEKIGYVGIRGQSAKPKMGKEYYQC